MFNAVVYEVKTYLDYSSAMRRGRQVKIKEVFVPELKLIFNRPIDQFNYFLTDRHRYVYSDNLPFTKILLPPELMTMLKNKADSLQEQSRLDDLIARQEYLGDYRPKDSQNDIEENFIAAKDILIHNFTREQFEEYKSGVFIVYKDKERDQYTADLTNDTNIDDYDNYQFSVESILKDLDYRPLIDEDIIVG